MESSPDANTPSSLPRTANVVTASTPIGELPTQFLNKTAVSPIDDKHRDEPLRDLTFKQLVRTISNNSLTSTMAEDSAIEQTDVASESNADNPKRKKKAVNNWPVQHQVRRSERAAKIQPEFAGLDGKLGIFKAHRSGKAGTRSSRGQDATQRVIDSQDDSDGLYEEDDCHEQIAGKKTLIPARTLQDIRTIRSIPRAKSNCVEAHSSSPLASAATGRAKRPQTLTLRRASSVYFADGSQADASSPIDSPSTLATTSVGRRQPSRAAAVKGRDVSRAMATVISRGSSDSGTDEESPTRLRKGKKPSAETKEEKKKKDKNKNKESKYGWPLSDFEWDVPVDEELGGTEVKEEYSLEFEESRVARNMAGDYDPHTPAQVGLQHLQFSQRVRRAMEVWPVSNVRGAWDPEREVKDKMARMIRLHLTKEKMEEAQKRKAEEQNAEVEDSEGGWQANLYNEEMACDSAEAGSAPQEEVVQEDDSMEEEAFKDQHGHPDIPRSFTEDFRRRHELAVASTRRARDPFHRLSHSASFHQPLFSASYRPSSIAGISHLPPSINDVARQQAAYAADFPALAPAPGHTQKMQMVRRVAQEMMDQADAIEAEDARNGRVPFDGPVRTHDFEYRNLVASGRLGGPADPRTRDTLGRCGTRSRGSVTHQPTGPHVADAGGRSAAESRQAYNNRIMALMTDRMGLDLEQPPAAGETFPRMTGPWPRGPEEMHHSMMPYSDGDEQRFDEFFAGPPGVYGQEGAGGRRFGWYRSPP